MSDTSATKHKDGSTGSNGTKPKPPQVGAGRMYATTEERRQHERVALSAEVSLVSETNVYAGLTCDVSEGGIFLATYQLLPKGTQVDLEASFELVGGPRMSLKAEVRWVREAQPESDVTPGMGLRFIDIEEPQREWLANFVTRREPMLFEDVSVERPLAAGISEQEASEADLELIGARSSPWRLGVMIAVVVLGVIVGLGYLLFGGRDDTEQQAASGPRVSPVQAPVQQSGNNKATAQLSTMDEAASRLDAASGAATDALASQRDGIIGDMAGTADSATPATADSPASTTAPVDDAPAAESAGIVAGASANKQAAPENAASAAAVNRAATTDVPAHVRAEQQVAEVVRSCLPHRATGATLKLALYTRSSGEVVRALVSGRVGRAKIRAKTTACLRRSVQRMRLPLKRRKAGYIQWHVVKKASTVSVAIVSPKYLRTQR